MSSEFTLAIPTLYKSILHPLKRERHKAGEVMFHVGVIEETSDMIVLKVRQIITFRISGGGFKIAPVCVCVCL